MKTFDSSKSLRRYQIAGFVSIFVMVGVFGGWTALADIHGAVIAPAVITVESYTKKIQHKEGGIIAAIRVRDGDVVKEGQELVVMDDTDTKAELGVVDSILTEMQSKRARLEGQRDGSAKIDWPPEIVARKDDPEVARIMNGQQRLFDSRRAAIAGKKEQLGKQINQLKEQIEGIVARSEEHTSELQSR